MSIKNSSLNGSQSIVINDRRASTQLLSKKGYLPIGSIIAWVGGSFSDGNNGGFNQAYLGDSYLQGLGFYICNGQEVNHPNSVVWNTSGRKVPTLTDDRFLSGFSTVATSTNGAAASNMMPDHAHNSGLTVTADATHVHGWGSRWSVGSARTANITYSDGSGGYWTDYGFAMSLSYTYAAHVHGQNCAANAAIDSRVYTYNGDQTAHAYEMNQYTSSVAMPAHTHQVYDPTHRHFIKTRTMNAGTSHTHTLSGTVGTGSLPAATDNRPKYLKCLMIIRVF